MSEQKKSNTAYYICQFIGFAISFAMSILGIMVTPEYQTPLLKDSMPWQIVNSIISSVFFLLTSHFLIRAYHSQNQVTNFSAYLKVIFQCSLITTTTNLFFRWLLDIPVPNIFPYDQGLVLEFIVEMFYAFIAFLIWSLIYLTITSIRDRRKLAEQLKEQQLASLMNQINPHFLFNSLNTIRGMIFEDEDKAAELITQLSTLFRYNLSTDTKAHTTLGKELAVCQHYLAIEDTTSRRTSTHQNEYF